MKASNISIIVISLAAVIGLFILFMPAEPGLIYWVNFIWSLIAVGAFTTYISVAKTDDKKHSSAVTIALGVYLGLYAVMLFVVMTAHFALVEPGVIWILADFPSPYARLLAKLAPLFQENPELGQKIYLGVLITMTVIFAIIVIIVLRTDKDYVESEKKLDAETNSQRNLAFQMRKLAMEYLSKCQQQGVDFSNLPVGLTPIHQVAKSFESLTPNVLRNPSARNELTEILDKAEALVNEPLDENSKEKMEKWAKLALEQIKLIKQISKS